MNETIIVNEIEYMVIKLLGKGKGGYSYLVRNGEQFYTLKKIHHEPCEYYQFGNKIEAELKHKGIGTALLLMAEEYMKNNGITVSKVHLGTPKEEWFESYSFYPKH